MKKRLFFVNLAERQQELRQGFTKKEAIEKGCKEQLELATNCFVPRNDKFAMTASKNNFDLDKILKYK